MAKIIRRVKGGNQWSTVGKDYAVDDKGEIIDDKGHILKPYYGSGNWEVLSDTKVGIKTESKENTMLKIEEAVLINGKNVRDLTTKQLIEHIVSEEAKIEQLTTINIQSEAISKIKAKHFDNVTRLVIVLDNREDLFDKVGE